MVAFGFSYNSCKSLIGDLISLIARRRKYLSSLATRVNKLTIRSRTAPVFLTLTLRRTCGILVCRVCGTSTVGTSVSVSTESTGTGAFSGPAPVTGASGSRGARSGHVILTKPERGRRRQLPLALQEVFY